MVQVWGRNETCKIDHQSVWYESKHNMMLIKVKIGHMINLKFEKLHYDHAAFMLCKIEAFPFMS